jgi:fatty acid desaturase
MSHGRPPAGDGPGATASRETAVAVISAYGAFRLLLVLLAVWTFLEGFALVSGALNALSLGGHDRNAERIIGAQMIVLVPIYGVLVWQRERYRLLIWVPYAAQLAIMLPTGWALLHADTDNALLFAVSAIFFVLLFYLWWHSHPLDFYQPPDDDATDGEEEEDGTAEDEEADGEEDQDESGEEPPDRDERPRRYRRK